MGTGERERSTGVRSAWSLLRRNPDFRKLFLASVISLGGDWFLFVAIGGLVFESSQTALSIGVLIFAQEVPIFLATPFAGWLADHLDRRKLMIACDLARTAICAAFLLVGPDNLWLAYALLAVLSVFAAIFDPASSAALPNVVDGQDLAVANAISGSLWGTMLAVGAALGGLVSATFGADAAFLVDAVSFAISAALLALVRRPFSLSREGDARPGLVEATVETARFARRDHRVLALISVKFGFGLAGGVLSLIAIFGIEVFDSGNIGFGLLMASRGVGALVGPFLGHKLSGADHQHLLRAIALALAVFGAGYVLVGTMPSLLPAMAAVLIAHLGGGAQWMLSSYGLQRLVPDRIRGRIFAFDFALVTLSFGMSSLVASALADALGPRPAVMIVGGSALALSIVWWLLTSGVRRGPLFDDGREPPSEPTATTLAIE